MEKSTTTTERRPASRPHKATTTTTLSVAFQVLEWNSKYAAADQLTFDNDESAMKGGNLDDDAQHVTMSSTTDADCQELISDARKVQSQPPAPFPAVQAAWSSFVTSTLIVGEDCDAIYRGTGSVTTFSNAVDSENSALNLFQSIIDNPNAY